MVLVRIVYQHNVKTLTFDVLARKLSFKSRTNHFSVYLFRTFCTFLIYEFTRHEFFLMCRFVSREIQLVPTSFVFFGSFSHHISLANIRQTTDLICCLVSKIKWFISYIWRSTDEWIERENEKRTDENIEVDYFEEKNMKKRNSVDSSRFWVSQDFLCAFELFNASFSRFRFKWMMNAQ